MPRLNAQQADQRLKKVPGWTRRARAIHRRFEFKGFMGSIDFVEAVAVKAEKADHHPDIDIRWNKVTLTLSTHSAGGLTSKDFAMALQCDALYARFF